MTRTSPQTFEGEMCPGDYAIYSSGPLGAKTSVSIVDENFLGEYSGWNEAQRAICADMEKEQFYPNVWMVSDHGNVIPLKINCPPGEERTAERCRVRGRRRRR